MSVESLSHIELIDLVTKQRSLLEQQASEIGSLKAQLKWFQNQIFGRKSERRLAGDSKYIHLTLGSLLEEETPPAPTGTVKEYQRCVKPEKLSESSKDESALRFSSDAPVKTITLTLALRSERTTRL